MCGIAGLIRWGQQAADLDAADADRCKLMLAAIRHRGPAAQGSWIDPRTHASVLLHARLPIIDLPGGAQPMGNEDGLVQVVFNGEIYNHHDLRDQLRSAGHTFHSDHSDTEVLVHGWEQWQTDLPRHLVGMFSFAIWDLRAKALFLCRDRLGQKPLFFMTTSNGIAFASTIPALIIAQGGPPAVPMSSITRYLTTGYTAPPHTIYPAVAAVAPGAGVLFTDGSRRESSYWQPNAALPTSIANPAGQGDCTGQLYDLLADAVESQLMADVPITCFLSGGVDSSIIAALVQQRQRSRGGDAITTLSVGFSEDGFDESVFAAEVARHIGSRHHEVRLGPRNDAMETLEWLMQNVLGQPFADSSLLPTYYLANAARCFAPVALSGDGADECFGGYDRYRAMRLMSRWPGLAALGAWLPGGRRVERWRRLRTACAGRGWSSQYAGLTDIFSPADMAGLGPAIAAGQGAAGQAGAADQCGSASSWRNAMLLDQQRYLPGDVLWKVDSASMANALEVRSPFLDHRVVEFANGLADALILDSRRGKLLLRQAFGPLLPKAVFTRKKHGFAMPVGEWFRGPLQEPLLDRLRDSAGFCRNYLSSAGTEQLVRQHISQERDHTHRLFALLMLEIWFHQFHPVITT